MATSKIRKVTVHYPTPENEEEFQRRAAQAFAKVLIKEFSPEVISECLKEMKGEKK